MVRVRAAPPKPTTLVLPPIYRPERVGKTKSAFAAACKFGTAGDAEGLFVWVARDDLVDCAVVLAPDRSLTEARKAVYVAMVGAGDALGAVVPPAVEVTFGWPNRLLINGAVAGGCRFAADPVATDAEPGWAAVGLTLRLAPEPGMDDPGNSPDRTTLFDEGCGELTVPVILESFARHFLYWINRWQDDEFDAVQSSWMARAAGRDRSEVFTSGEARAEGTVFDFNRDGGLVVKADGGAMETLPLGPGLDAPAWEPG